MAKKKEQIRLHNFLRALSIHMEDDVYADIDEKTGEVIYEDTEEDVYNDLMKTDEWHLMGEDRVRELIHMWYTDWHSMSNLLMSLEA